MQLQRDRLAFSVYCFGFISVLFWILHSVIFSIGQERNLIPESFRQSTSQSSKGLFCSPSKARMRTQSVVLSQNDSLKLRMRLFKFSLQFILDWISLVFVQSLWHNPVQCRPDFYTYRTSYTTYHTNWVPYPKSTVKYEHIFFRSTESQQIYAHTDLEHHKNPL